MSHLPASVRLAVAGSVGALVLALAVPARAADAALVLNDLEYLEMPGLNVMLAHDFYPEGHQGGVGIIQNGQRTATNGDIRLEPTPGQWQPVPKVGKRVVDRATGEISVRMEYPDPAKDRKGFNPIVYPDLHIAYTIRVRPEGAGSAFRIVVDFEQPIPEAWVGRIGFNLELFPGLLYGRTFAAESGSGIFPRQANGPGFYDAQREYQLVPLATGPRLLISGESDQLRMVIESIGGGPLQLIDGRGQHNNGWFVVRSLVPAGKTAGAIEWRVSAHAIPGWKSAPVVQVSQVGYLPAQRKVAVVELDRTDESILPVQLLRVAESGGLTPVLERAVQPWGRFLRYRYLQLDFSEVTQPGMYVVRYGTVESSPFKVGPDVFARDVWQPTLETFLPVQMCHVRVNDRYRVWHDFCHLDDARMAPVNHNHFDGYLQGPSTLCEFQPGQHVPGLDRGGWHDAGDDDLRVESQAETIYGLALAWEAFQVDYDNTTVDQATRVVELHRPDGVADILQQIEHGALTIVGGYRSMGRLYRGIIVPTLRQYVLLGDFSAVSDNVPFTGDAAAATTPPVGLPGSADDRWVFTEDNPRREIQVAACLAAASRALRTYRPELAAQCLTAARELWDRTKVPDEIFRTGAAVELLVATGEAKYADWLKAHADTIAARIAATPNPTDGPSRPRFSGWMIGRAVPLLQDAAFTQKIRDAVKAHQAVVATQARKTPYGVPYEPAIWGAGWLIQRFGMEQVFLHRAFPDLVSDEYMLNALNFILGCHPGPNTSSFVSGVGAKSLTTAYGMNRGDESYIPGGSASGTALIRPDFPELLDWPYLWQQTEYVLGGGTTDWLILALAANTVSHR
ncbi:MAG: glycoside hydrolase family 9 protein [Opitutaceae bacterium]|nr:glycoside hydrolase family 9 protein [Opitutaceae bacterium]